MAAIKLVNEIQVIARKLQPLFKSMAVIMRWV